MLRRGSSPLNTCHEDQRSIFSARSESNRRPQRPPEAIVRVEKRLQCQKSITDRSVICKSYAPCFPAAGTSRDPKVARAVKAVPQIVAHSIRTARSVVTVPRVWASEVDFFCHTNFHRVVHVEHKTIAAAKIYVSNAPNEIGVRFKTLVGSLAPWPRASDEETGCSSMARSSELSLKLVV